MKCELSNAILIVWFFCGTNITIYEMFTSKCEEINNKVKMSNRLLRKEVIWRTYFTVLIPCKSDSQIVYTIYFIQQYV